MEKTIIKSLVLFLSVPFFNALGLGFTTLIHGTYQSSITLEQFDAYAFSMLFMLFLLAIVIPLFEGLYDSEIISSGQANALYVLVLIVIAVVTSDQFIFRAYDHTLTFLSITSVIFSRELLNRKMISNIQYT